MSLDLENVLESNRLTLTKNLLNILASALPSVTRSLPSTSFFFQRLFPYLTFSRQRLDSFPKLFIVVSIT